MMSSYLGRDRKMLYSIRSEFDITVSSLIVILYGWLVGRYWPDACETENVVRTRHFPRGSFRWTLKMLFLLHVALIFSPYKRKTTSCKLRILRNTKKMTDCILKLTCSSVKTIWRVSPPKPVFCSHECSTFTWDRHLVLNGFKSLTGVRLALFDILCVLV